MTLTEVRAIERGEGVPVARFATGPVAAIAALVGLGHLVAASLTGGYWLDEAYMLAIGRGHLSPGDRPTSHRSRPPSRGSPTGSRPARRWSSGGPASSRRSPRWSSPR